MGTGSLAAATVSVVWSADHGETHRIDWDRVGRARTNSKV